MAADGLGPGPANAGPQAGFAPPKLSILVANHLRDRLLRGEYRAGERLAPQDIAAELGVSTMPVREALTELAAEGLAEALPRRGFRVRELGIEDIRDVFAVHSFVAGRLAERAASAIADDALDGLRASQEQIEREVKDGKGSREAALRVATLNFAFHRTINRASDSGRLRWFYRVAARYIPSELYVEAPGWLEMTVRDHPKLISALEARDPEAARRAACDHVDAACSLVMTHLSATGERGPAAPP